MASRAAAALLATCCVAAARAWQQLATPPWAPHTGSIAVTLADDSILLIAGQKGEHGGALFDCFNCTNEVWRYEHEVDTWKDMSTDVPWDPRWGHSAVATADDTVWMLFGCCERGKPTVMLRDVWTYTLGGPWVRQQTAPPFEGIQATSVSVRGDDLWVVGGWSQHRGTLSMVTVLSTKTLKWETKSEHGEVPWRHRADHCTAISPDGSWLFLYAGQHRELKTGNWFRLADTWKVPLPLARASAWTQIGDLDGARSSSPVLILPSGWLLAVGGHFVSDDEVLGTKQEDIDGMKKHHADSKTFKVYNDVQALDLTKGGEGGWHQVERDAPWVGRDDMAAAVTKKGSVLLFGGGRIYGGGGYLQDVWKLPDAGKSYSLQKGGAAKGAEL